MKKLDTTAWLGIVACIGLLGYSLQHNAKVTKERGKIMEQQRLEEDARKAELAETQKEVNALGEEIRQSAVDSDSIEQTGEAKIGPASVPGEEVELATGLFKLALTNKGAGIKTAQLLEHNRLLEPDGKYVTINETRPYPIGALSSKPNEIDDSIWAIKDKTDQSVSFEVTTPQNLKLLKTFRVSEDKPYQVEMALSITNETGGPIELNQTDLRYIYAGGAAPLHFGEWSMQMGLFYREDGSTFRTRTVDYFGGKKKIMGMFGRSEKPYAILPGEERVADNLAYAGINNQYYATLIQARVPEDGQVWADKYSVVVDGDVEQSKAKRVRGCELAMGLPAMSMSAGDSTTLEYDLYIGPKESSILKQSDQGWKMIMNYDQIPIFGKLFGWAISPLAAALSWGLVTIKGVVGNYGIAIILLTILIRLLMWPVYAKSTRSMKRMSKLTPLMKEIKEKYPDDPQKVNKETMALYSQYGVNPMGGCLPMFLQLPVFLGFYRMLWGAVELRHEPFAFVQDLTMPDNLAMIPGLGIPLNILPILMAIASFIQMAMTPKTGDNTQRMIFMMMPVMFLVFCYNFASGLALYWTVSNVFTVLQTWIMNKLPEPELKPKENGGKVKKKSGMMEKFHAKMDEIQAQAETNKSGGGSNTAASVPKKSKKKAQDNQPQAGQSRTKLASDKGSRHTKPKKKKR